MITGVAFCPQAPALVPGVGRGLDAELGAVRQACRTAIRRVAVAGTRIVVVGAGPRNASYGPSSRGSFSAFGVALEVPLGSDAPGPVDLPPALTVGAWLVRDAVGPDSGAVARAVTDADGSLPEARDDGPTALIVVGDGSARRSDKAPGHFDARAGAFDAAVARALAGGDPGALALDPALGADLMAAGAAAWAATWALLAGTTWDADLLHDDAPFGVGYLVATWLADRDPRA